MKAGCFAPRDARIAGSLPDLARGIALAGLALSPGRYRAAPRMRAEPGTVTWRMPSAPSQVMVVKGRAASGGASLSFAVRIRLYSICAKVRSEGGHRAPSDPIPPSGSPAQRQWSPLDAGHPGPPRLGARQRRRARPRIARFVRKQVSASMPSAARGAPSRFAKALRPLPRRVRGVAGPSLILPQGPSPRVGGAQPLRGALRPRRRSR